MMLSPDSKQEDDRLKKLRNGISLFVSGYLISKIDPLVAKAMEPDLLFEAEGQVLLFRLVGGGAVVILSALVVYVMRIYAWTAGE